MTPAQKTMLSAIELLTVDGISPSYEELMNYLGLNSKSGVHRLVVALERDGYIVRSPVLARSIQVVHPLRKAIADLFERFGVEAVSDMVDDLLAVDLSRVEAS